MIWSRGTKSSACPPAPAEAVLRPEGGGGLAAIERVRRALEQVDRFERVDTGEELAQRVLGDKSAQVSANKAAHSQRPGAAVVVIDQVLDCVFCEGIRLGERGAAIRLRQTSVDAENQADIIGRHQDPIAGAPGDRHVEYLVAQVDHLPQTFEAFQDGDPCGRTDDVGLPVNLFE